MGFEPDRDRFFQYATFITIGMTVLVCACYALLFFNPRANPIAVLRPETPTPNLDVAELPATWTPTSTATATNTPLPTATFTATPPISNTPTETAVPPEPTLEPSPTIFYIVVTGVAPTRLPTRRPAPVVIPNTPVPAPLPPPQLVEFRLGRPVESAPNCGAWYVAGTIYSDQNGTNKLNGILVRIWASGIEQGTDTSGSHGGRAGYWEWNFGRDSSVIGEVAVVNPDGSLRSPKVPFTMTSSCNGDGAVQQNVIDFVGN